ncbi:MAG: hypothetical protein Q8L55_09890 [Phycisphaerales bacterium]|nr:hypothetical protein [Phycisphaerales bacterium]
MRKALIGATLGLSLAAGTTAQTDISAAFQTTTCSTYVSGQSWLMMACGQNTGFTTIIGNDAATSTVKEMATVTDYTMMGKKPIETYSESFFLVDQTNARIYSGSGTFNSYTAVLKVQNSCGQTGFVAGTIVSATLTSAGSIEGAVYFVPFSFHADEVAAEKAAAAISADDPGEVGDYPPNMGPDVTLPSQPNPNTFLPGKYIPGPNAPADAAEQARICYDAYRAACRTAFTNYKNTLANVRRNRMQGAVNGGAVGAAAGGGLGLVLVGVVCVFTGPPGWAAGIGIVTVGATIGGVGGAVAGPTIAVVEAKQAAILVLKNDMDSAYAGYIKCLEGHGYIRNPFYP